MNRTYILRRAAAATVIGVAATVVTLAAASPAHAEGNAVCNEYRAMANDNWNRYFAETDKSWNANILIAASWLTTAQYWQTQAANACY